MRRNGVSNSLLMVEGRCVATTMGRLLRVAPGELIYHVLNRANGRQRQRLFDNDGDYRAFERVMTQACDRVSIQRLAYCGIPFPFSSTKWFRSLPLMLREACPERFDSAQHRPVEACGEFIEPGRNARVGVPHQQHDRKKRLWLGRWKGLAKEIDGLPKKKERGIL